jgi:hypothetical protein
MERWLMACERERRQRQAEGDRGIFVRCPLPAPDLLAWADEGVVAP